MKLGIFKDIDWSYVGALLANSDDTQQIEFFKGFYQECKSWGTNYQIQQQFYNINAGLNNEEREAFKMISFTGE